jgi:hypothetical protein
MQRPILLVAVLIYVAPLVGAASLHWAIGRSLLLLPWWVSAVCVVLSCVGLGGAAGWALHRALQSRATFSKPLWSKLAGASFAAVLFLVALSPLQDFAFEVTEAVMHLGGVLGFGLFVSKRRLPLAILCALCAGVCITILPDRYLELQRVLGGLCVGSCILVLRITHARRQVARETPTQSVWNSRPSSVLALALILIALGGGQWLLSTSGHFWTLKQGRGGVFSSWIRLAHSLSDFDRDGEGAVFAHHDCAPFDGARNTGRHELAGNGLDDNCLAGDSTRDPKSWLDAQTSVHPRPAAWSGDVLLVVVDTLRFDDSQASGFPNLNRMANEGVNFTRAYSTASFTSNAMMGHLGAMLPTALPMTWVHRMNGYPAEVPRGLPAMLRDAGFDTAFAGGFLDSENHYFSEETYGNGFRLLGRLGSTVTPAAVVDKALSQWSELDARGNRFMNVHFMSVHNYRPGDREGYRERIATLDAELGRLFEGVGPNTRILLTSDHGEEFGEHGGLTHASSLFEEQLRIPLMVMGPGLEPKRVDTLTSSLAIMPTLVAMLRLEGLPDGAQMYLCVDQSQGECRDMPAPMTLELQDLHFHGLVQGKLKIIRDLRRGVLVYYDLEQDPQEKNPRLEVPAQLEQALIDWEELHLGVAGAKVFDFN